MALCEWARVSTADGTLLLFHPAGRNERAARHGRPLSPDDPLAEPNLRPMLDATGWHLTAYDDAERHFLAKAVPARWPRTPSDGRRRLGRRALLGAGGLGVIGAGAGAAGLADGRTDQAQSARAKTVLFHGCHQAGILNTRQIHAGLAAFGFGSRTDRGRAARPAAAPEHRRRATPIHPRQGITGWLPPARATSPRSP